MKIRYQLATAAIMLAFAAAPAFAEPAAVGASAPAAKAHHSAHHLKTGHKSVKKVKAVIPAGPGTAGSGKP